MKFKRGFLSPSFLIKDFSGKFLISFIIFYRFDFTSVLVYYVFWWVNFEFSIVIFRNKEGIVLIMFIYSTHVIYLGCKAAGYGNLLVMDAYLESVW